MRKIIILDVDYILEDGKPVIRIFGQTRDGRNAVVFVRWFKPYFYVQPRPDLDKKNLEALRKRILKLEIGGRKPEAVEIVKKNILGKETLLLKVVATVPADVPKLRDLLKEWDDVREEYEYGISFYKRFLIDSGLLPMKWMSVEGDAAESEMDADIAVDSQKVEDAGDKLPSIKTLAFDIETVEENGEERIIMISLKDNKGFEKLITYKRVGIKGAVIVKDEASMLKKFLELVKERNPNIIVTYNGDRFDFLKLESQAGKYGIRLVLGRDSELVKFRRRGRISSARITGRVHVDLYDFVEHILSQSLTSEVLTLDMVAKEILGVGKEDVKWREIENAWKSGKNLKRIALYCKEDSTLTLKLAEHLLPLIFMLCKVTGLTLFDASRVSYSQLVENLLMRRAFEMGEIALNRPKFDEVQRRRKAEPYTGGYVHLPKKGIHDSIAVFDFMSLYPTIIVSYNISPETLDCGHSGCRKNKVPGNQHHFCTMKKGFIPVILEEIIRKRQSIKKEMKKAKPKTQKYKDLYNEQYALKILANSFYGYLGFASSRWYSRVCAQATSMWGRYYIKKVIRMAEKEGLDVIYGDTDSLFLKIGKKSVARKFLKKINSSLPDIMELEFKGLYKRGIFIEAKTGIAAKKKYALLDENNNLIVRGMETRRRDWAAIAKETQEKVLDAILRKKSTETALEAVRKTIDELKKGMVKFDDLIIYTQLTKPLKEYEQMGPHVKVAKKILERGGVIGEGSTIAYIVTKGMGSISERAEPVEDAENYDPDYYIHHQVIPAALRILSGFGFDEKDLLGEEKQKSLDGFLRG
jgi:DNA polymerase elongation subunit (family B)